MPQQRAKPSKLADPTENDAPDVVDTFLNTYVIYGQCTTAAKAHLKSNISLSL